jgi:MYXO-CTERM domain-containing protein
MDCVIPLHMGSLHPYEQALTLLLAFGPFVVLGLVMWRRRREDVADAEDVSG